MFVHCCTQREEEWHGVCQAHLKYNLATNEIDSYCCLSVSSLPNSLPIIDFIPNLQVCY